MHVSPCELSSAAAQCKPQVLWLQLRHLTLCSAPTRLPPLELLELPPCFLCALDFVFGFFRLSVLRCCAWPPYDGDLPALNVVSRISSDF